MLFTEFAHNRIFLKGPSYEIFEGHFVDFFAHDSVESISAQDKAGYFFVGFYSQLPHGVVIERLLSERVSFVEFPKKFAAFIY